MLVLTVKKQHTKNKKLEKCENTEEVLFKHTLN